MRGTYHPGEIKIHAAFLRGWFSPVSCGSPDCVADAVSLVDELADDPVSEIPDEDSVRDPVMAVTSDDWALSKIQAKK